ncbi:MAG: amidohydrolase family protein [Eubacteriales bacterium]|nr:amidohydrolase family protein [Eubacteriales bacterium]
MLLINGKIYTMAGPVIDKGYVKIEGSKIAGTGKMDDLKNSLQGSEEDILDVKGAWVLPGLIEAHAHIGITEEKTGLIGDDCNEQTDPVTTALRAIDAVNPMDPAFHDAIQAGITSVMAGPGSANVVGGQFVFMKTQGRCIDDMIVKNPAAMKVAFGENPKTTYGDQNRCPSTRMGVAYMLRKELFKAVQYRERLKNDPHMERDFDLEPWLKVLDGEIPMKAHAHRADDILTAIRIAKEFHVDITIDHCTEGHFIAEEIAESGFPAIVGTDLTARSKIEVEYMSFKTAHILAEAGVKVAVTTDHPVALIQYLPLCAGLAVKYGLSVEEGLKALTIHPAEICRVDDRVGSLEKGKDADIAVFDGNPMEVFTKTLYTIINGKIVYKDSDWEN